MPSAPGLVDTASMIPRRCRRP